MREWYANYRSGERRAGIAAVIDPWRAHKAVGEALGGPTSAVTVGAWASPEARHSPS
jgi:hypothetical protein